MEKHIQELISATLAGRKQYVLLLEDYTTEQVNFIPTGYNNNIFWNVAHVVAVQQMIVYGLAEQEYAYPKDQVLPFRKGPKPEMHFDESLVNTYKIYLTESIDKLIVDIEENKFTQYKPWTASTGFTVYDLGSALTFNLFHESLHLGQMVCLKRLLS